MKRFILSIMILTAMCATYCFAEESIPIKGDVEAFGAAYINATTVIISSTDWGSTDYAIKNYGPYDIWVDTAVASVSTFTVTGSIKESYRFEVGEVISPDGQVYGGGIFGRTATLGAGSTVYYYITRKTK